LLPLLALYHDYLPQDIIVADDKRPITGAKSGFYV